MVSQYDAWNRLVMAWPRGDDLAGDEDRYDGLHRRVSRQRISGQQASGLGVTVSMHALRIPRGRSGTSLKYRNLQVFTGLNCRRVKCNPGPDKVATGMRISLASGVLTS